MDHVTKRWWLAPRWVATAGVIVATVVAVFASATLLGPAANAGVTEQSTVERFGGEDLVDGLLFGLGPAARAHPDLVLTPVPVRDIPENTRMLKQMYTDIERDYPGALDRFAEAMYSGDRVRVNDVALETIRLLQEALPVVNPDDRDPGSGLVTTTCIILYCGVIYYSQPFYIYPPFWYADSFVGTPDVQFERWVDSIASNVS